MNSNPPTFGSPFAKGGIIKKPRRCRGLGLVGGEELHVELQSLAAHFDFYDWKSSSVEFHFGFAERDFFVVGIDDDEGILVLGDDIV